MKSKLLLAALLLGSVYVSAQTLGEFKPKETSFGMGKLKKGANKLYIANFTVNYQVYNEKEKFKQGGYQLGGSVKGDAKSAVSVGLSGLSEQDVQKITDKLYQDYLALIKAKGLAIISAEEAGKTSVYADYTKLTGGTISMAEMPGTMSSAPTGFEYYVKGLDKDGKTKKGGFLGNVATMYPRLSSDLGDAIIADVNLTVLFVEDQNAFQGNGANVKVKTNLRLAGNEAITMTSDAKIKFKGANTVTYVNSLVNFYHGKMGMGATTTYAGSLSRSFAIDDVIEDKTIQSFAKGSVDHGTKTIYGTYFSPASGSSETSKVIPVDVAKYTEGVYSAAKKFVEHHTKGFLAEF